MGESDDANTELVDLTKNRKTVLYKVLPWLIVLIVVVAGLLWFRGMKSSDPSQEQIQVTEKKKEPMVRKEKIIRPIEVPKEVQDIDPDKTPSESIAKIEPDLVSEKAPPLLPPSEKPVPAEIPSIEIENYPYSLHMGSYRTLKYTEKYIASLGDKGLSPYWVVVDLGEKGVWYRVFLGHFKTPDQANAFQTEHGIKASRIINSIYAVQIGLYSSKEELDQRFAILRNAGYCPYVIEQAQGQSQLLVGAFQTKEAAEGLTARLKNSDEDCKAILR